MEAKRVVINGVLDVKIISEKLDVSSLKPNQCLIETEVSLISPGTELSRVYGLKVGATYPVYPGYCSVGRILEVGSNLTHLKPGDRVLFSGSHTSLQIYDYTKSDGGILYPLADKTDSIAGAFLNMAWIATNGILPAEVKLGDTVVVLGLGMLGLIVSLYYQKMGAKVIALDPITSRTKLAQKMGIKAAYDVKPENQEIEVSKLLKGQGADIVIDATGLSAAIETALKMAAPYGQVVLMGSPRSPYQANLTDSFSLIHMKMLTVIGALNRRYPVQPVVGSRLNVTETMAYLEELIAEKYLDVDLFISHIIEPTEKELLEAYDGLMNHKDSYHGVIIDWRKAK